MFRQQLMPLLQWNRTILHSQIKGLVFPHRVLSVIAFMMSRRFNAVLAMKCEAATVYLNGYKMGARLNVYDIVDKRVLTVSIFEGVRVSA